MMRRPAQRVKPKLARDYIFPAPLGGWIKNVNLASPDARRPDGSRINGAALLENWFPTATGIRMRWGSEDYAVLSGGGTVTSMFTYLNGNNRRLFACNANGIFDITTVAAVVYLVDGNGNYLIDDLGNRLVTSLTDPVVSSLTGGDWIVTQFATSGGVFLRAVNGADTSLVFDGSSWNTSPAITGVASSSLSYVWPFKQRLFFIQKDTLDAWYLQVDTIGGASTKLPLGGVFKKGGSLIFGATWSLDTGGGLSEQCAFFSSEGEVAVYQGTDPGNAATWAKVGVYQIGKPRGPRAFIRAGGDLVVSTDIGFVPLSIAVQRDLAALSPSAISYNIETAWNEAVRDRSSTGWNCEVWPTKQMVIVALPTPSGGQSQVFVANARTGAWSLFTGWDVTAIAVFGDRMFYGSKNGRVIECEVTGADRGKTYSAAFIPLFESLKAPAVLKTGLMARYTVRAPVKVKVKLTFLKDHTVTLPSPPDDISIQTNSAWGTGIWGTSLWASPLLKQTYKGWQSLSGAGYAVSVGAQITSGSVTPPDVEYVQTDMTYDMGDIVS